MNNHSLAFRLETFECNTQSSCCSEQCLEIYSYYITIKYVITRQIIIGNVTRDLYKVVVRKTGTLFTQRTICGELGSIPRNKKYVHRDIYLEFVTMHNGECVPHRSLSYLTTAVSVLREFSLLLIIIPFSIWLPRCSGFQLCNSFCD